MLSLSHCCTLLLVLRFGPLMAAIQMDFNIREEKCLIGKAVKNFILHLKCKNMTRNVIQLGNDSCIMKPYNISKREDVAMDITPGSTDFPCQMTRDMMISKSAFCVNVYRECRDIRYDIDTSSVFRGNQTDALSITLALNTSQYSTDSTKNFYEIFDIFLEANVKDADCMSKISCAWSAHNMQWNNQEFIYTGSINQLGSLSSPLIFGSTGSACLKWRMGGSGNVSVFVNTSDSDSPYAMKTYFVQNNTLEYTWTVGKIHTPFAVHFRFYGIINSIKMSNIAFSTCEAESFRNCTFEKNSSCPFIESYRGCSLNRSKGDPHKETHEWMLLTRKDYCENGNIFTSAFSTVTLPPVQGNNTCKVLLETYGNLRWYWRICSLKNICSNRTISDRSNATPLQSKTFHISNISQRYRLEFSTLHLDSKTFLGIIKLAFSESCFDNSSSNTIIHVPLDFTQEHNTHLSPSVFMVIAILVICLLVLFIISLGIVRKRRRFCLYYKSDDANDKKVSIHDFLATKTVEKSLENILTEGNPHYRWYCHRLLKGTMVDIDKSQIQIHTLLGRGAFGEVFRGILLGRERNGKNTDIAIKRLSKSADQQSQDDFLLEALILFKFQHKNIVNCLGISSSNGVYMILLELMLGGDLKTFLRNTKDKQTQKSTLKISELLRLASDVACGLNYLESLHFVHRDVAARNCLLTNLGPNRVAKLGDFGMAKDILMNAYYRKEGTALLPIRWMPPESFLEGYFSSKSDVWAFGVLMWEIFTSGFIPYPGLQNNAVMTFVNKGGRLEMPALCTQSIYDLMCFCWQSDPMERPSFQTVYRFLIMTHKKFQNEESMSDDKCTDDKSSPRYCSKVFNEEESSPLMLIDEICRGGM